MRVCEGDVVSRFKLFTLNGDFSPAMIKVCVYVFYYVAIVSIILLCYIVFFYLFVIYIYLSHFVAIARAR